jgi:predicted O-methyltransferase YrrM
MNDWKDVEGYFEYPSFYELCLNNVPENGVFVELGSWMGRSTSCMGQLIQKNNRNIKFYAIDTWEGSDEEDHYKWINRLKKNNTTLYDTFINNVRRCGVLDLITPIRSTSIEAAKQFEDNSIDVIHIDAAHDYDNVIQDIIAWYPKIKDGGIITGDDWWWPGVRQAVLEFFKDKSLFFIDHDNKGGQVWLHKKTESNKEPMEVTLYAIAKNEEQNVEKFLKNTEKFSDVVVVDTGSTDNTVNLLRAAGIKVFEHPQSRNEFDFALARNTALSYVTTDWAVSLDFNEDLSDFYPEGFDVVEKEFTKFKHLRFDDLGEGEPKQSFEVHTRIHRTNNYKWVNAVHEIPVFVPTEEYPTEIEVDTTIKIIKKVSKTVDKELFYLSICEREQEKDPDNWYWSWFIFNHYYQVRNINKALEWGQEFLNVSKAYFNSLRVSAFIRCSQIYYSVGNIQLSANYAFHALSEAMNMGDEQKSMAFQHLFDLGTKVNNPNIIVFASAFNQDTLTSPKRTESIEKLFLTNLDDIPTSWRGHRAFAEWLVTNTKPEVIVDLGVNYGFSTFALALPRIGHVYGIDNFDGDDFIGTGNLSYDFVITKREKLFLEDHVTFIKGSFDDVAKTWDKKIDILHIDGSHHYEDVKKDYETWAPFVKDDGIILFHDTCVDELNNDDYGVRKFFGELDLPKVTFTHSFGLGVASKNAKLIEIIKTEFNL